MSLYNDYADTAIKMGGQVFRRREDGYDVEFSTTSTDVRIVQFDGTHLLLVSQDESLNLADYNFGEISIL